MKLATFTTDGFTRLGVVIEDHVIDLSKAAPQLPTDMLALLESGSDGMDAVKNVATKGREAIPLSKVRLEAPVRPRKYWLIGRNYTTYVPRSEAAPGDDYTAARLKRAIKHVLDVEGMRRAGHQLWVSKAVTAINGPFDPIVIPKVSDEVIYENELGVVIGKRSRYVAREDARHVIAGYLICNEVSASDWSSFSPSFTLGKSFDTFGPIGPWLVTSDEIEDPHSLKMRVYLSGKLDQEGNTADMIDNCWDLIAYLSKAVTLEPGDVLATGMPDFPRKFLKEGDVVRCEIDRIGHIENPIVKER